MLGMVATSLSVSGIGVSMSAWAADDYPNRSILFQVPQAVGGSTDTLGRSVAMKLADAIGQPVVVENRPGANGIVGCDLVAKSRPDGYTLLVGGTGTMAINQSIYVKLPYDADRDFAPIAMFGYTTDVLVVHPSITAPTIGELIKYLKANPGKVSYASAGAGSSPHLAAEMFKQMASVDILHVPYKGSTPGVMATAAGDTQMMFTGVASSIAQIKSGRLRALSITGPKRAVALPEVPTASESGLPGFEAEFWIGLFGPADVPKPVIDRLNGEVNRILASKDMVDRFALLGIDPAPMSPGRFAEHVRKDVVTWEKIVKTAGIKGD
jgi:tripartite-type tricarboxylate transporter receptor subunit TctC